MLTVELETRTRLVVFDAGRCVGALKFFRNRVYFHPGSYSLTFSDFAPGMDLTAVVYSLYDALVRELRPTNPLLLRTGVD